MIKQHADYDSPWKEVLERYFKDFMAFFFPQAYDGIDWSRGYEFLDKELQQVVRDAELGCRLVDKLIKVWRKNGEEAWVAIHIEVQGQVDTEFPERLYVYNYRLFDRYKRKVVTLAVLADDRATWRPDEFGYELWGCEVSLKFPVVKLLDYEARVNELEESENPFAVVVLAHLKTLSTRRKPDIRFQWKVSLVKMLYERGYSREDILELFRFIDWVMVLPEDLEQQFTEIVEKYEEERKMQYVTSVERIGIKKGLQQGTLETSREAVIEILKARFKRVPRSIVTVVNGIEELPRLKKLLRKAATVESLDEFRDVLGLKKRVKISKTKNVKKKQSSIIN